MLLLVDWLLNDTQAGDAGAARLIFCVGGPFGHSQKVIERADDVIKLSSCVLNHQVRMQASA